MPLTTDQIEQFDRYAALIVEWNGRFNLTRITDPAGIARRHFLDSLTVASIWTPRRGDRAIDIGSGAGLPGLALKILWPILRLTLVESTGKKAQFLHSAVNVLDLGGVTVRADRAEDLLATDAGAYDLVLARGVAALPVLIPITLPFAKPGGVLIAHKSGDLGAELDAAAPVIARFGGSPAEVVSEPMLDDHVLIRISKQAIHGSGEGAFGILPGA